MGITLDEIRALDSSTDSVTVVATDLDIRDLVDSQSVREPTCSVRQYAKRTRGLHRWDLLAQRPGSERMPRLELGRAGVVRLLTGNVG